MPDHVVIHDITESHWDELGSTLGEGCRQFTPGTQ